MTIFEAHPKIVRVLIADDHLALAEAVGNALCAPPRAFQAEISTNFTETMKLLSNDHSFDLVILDVKMPGMIGLKSITDAITAAKPAPVLLMSGNPDRALVQLSVEHGGRGIIPKSLSLQSLVSLVDFVLTGQTFIPSADIRESRFQTH
jgi:two-component system, NarL family, nitrate/nitrite response regulator NarL